MATKKATVAKPAERTSNQRYTAALAKLRDQHADEFEALLRVEWQADGLTYKRRLTAEERAAAKQAEAERKAAEMIAGLVAKFPNLAHDVSGVVNVGGLDVFSPAEVEGQVAIEEASA